MRAVMCCVLAMASRRAEHGEWATAFAQFAWELVVNYEQEDEEFVEASTTRPKQLQAFHSRC